MIDADDRMIDDDLGFAFAEGSVWRLSEIFM